MRSRALQIILLAAAAVFETACDPAFWLEGSVKSPTGALAEAEVTLSCSGDPRPLAHLTTGALGGFSYHQIPGLSPECRVVITKPGFRSSEVTLAEICHSHFGLSCTRARLDVELAPDK